MEYEPTLVDVSRQVGLLSQQMGAVLSAVSSNAQQTGFLAQRTENLEARLSGQISSVHRDVALIRTTQVTDHAPRILATEQEQQKTRSIAPAARGVAKYGGVAVGPWLVFEVIAAIQQHAGPIGQVIKTIREMF